MSLRLSVLYSDMIILYNRVCVYKPKKRVDIPKTLVSFLRNKSDKTDASGILIKQISSRPTYLIQIIFHLTLVNLYLFDLSIPILSVDAPLSPLPHFGSQFSDVIFCCVCDAGHTRTLWWRPWINLSVNLFYLLIISIVPVTVFGTIYNPLFNY